MKKTTFIPLLILLLCSTQCNTEQSLIKDTAYNYLDAMGNYRISEAAPYATKQTQEKTIRVINERIMPNMDSSYITKNTPAEITIKDVRMVNDTTAMVVYKKVTPIKRVIDSLKVVKQNGQWKASAIINARFVGDGKDSEAEKGKLPNPFANKGKNAKKQ